MTGQRNWRRWATGLLMVLLAAPFLASLVGLLPWSPINCWTYEVDLRSGRIRYTRYFAFLKVTQRIEESTFSRVLDPEDWQGCATDWRCVHTLSPGVRNSPHHTFHGAMSEMKMMEIQWRLGNFTSAARRASARRVLQLWREGGDDRAARDYQQELQRIGDHNYEAGRETDVSDLPAEEPATASEKDESRASE